MLKRLFDWFTRSSSSADKVIGAVIGALILVLVAGCAVALPDFTGRSAEEPRPWTGIPNIALEPAIGPVGTSVTVLGAGWSPGGTVFIYLAAPGQAEPPNYAAAGTTADAQGRFTTEFVVPSQAGWENQGLATVMARAAEGGTAAQAVFSVVGSPGATPPSTIEPGRTPGSPTPTAEPIVPTPRAGDPMVTATTNLNIRSGPGTVYPILGMLRIGQNASVTGVSPDGRWWQIRFSGIADPQQAGEPGRGWVSAGYVIHSNTRNVPVVQVSALPPTPTRVASNAWRGEYYSNRNLTGDPVLVRDDAAVNFDWRAGSPAAGLPTDRFSVRWSRSLAFAGGTYRFQVTADDGVRLWIDGSLIIDQWRDSPATTFSAEVDLTQGAHDIRVEFYENTGDALVQLSWEQIDRYSDWKAEYFNNPDLSGAAVLMRNDLGVRFDWGPNSPGPGIPADNFSARWSRSLHFPAGTYRFKIVVDDGARLWVDNFLVIDSWRTGPPKEYSAEMTLSEGVHHLRLEYFDFRYDAQVHLTWERVDNFREWKGEYFDNRRLQGDPILVRNDPSINFNWEGGSPGPRVPADDFSARWTRTAEFSSGTYVFSIWVDDGVRLWIDDSLVIDSWQDGSSRLLQAERQFSQGTHRLRIEYYERSGTAHIAVNWSRKQEPSNQAPQAIPGGPYAVDEGNSVSLDGSRSGDADGTIVKYEWDLNYNGRSFTPDAGGPTTSASYADGPATILVALRVTDDKGANHMATTEVKVNNLAPTAEAGGPYSGQVGSLITFAGTGRDPSSVDQSGLAYAWDFGDGAQASGPIVSHSYDQPGPYTVQLTVTDKDGGQGTDTATVQVSAVNQPPTAKISDAPSQGLVGETLIFDASESSDDGRIVGYEWDWGDGTTASGITATHVYTQVGTYTVQLIVTDDEGVSASAEHVIQIEEATQGGTSSKPSS